MRPTDFAEILGATFVRTNNDIVFQLTKGKGYTRFQLGEMGVPHLKAARFLHIICRRRSIHTLKDLADRIGELTHIVGLGHAAFYAALAILTAEGLRDRAIDAYTEEAVSKRYLANPNASELQPVPVKLSTMKHRRTPTTKTTIRKRRITTTRHRHPEPALTM